MQAGSPAPTQTQEAQLKRCLAANATPRLRLVCKELGMAGYSRISRSDLEDLLARHLQDRPDLFSLMVGLLSGGCTCVRVCLWCCSAPLPQI
jgi:hypothetical protein